MNLFIFRNNTIEPLFRGLNAIFSDYNDLSFIDPNADHYVWFYQVPFKFEQNKVAEEIAIFLDKLNLIIPQISIYKNVIIFSLVDLIPFKYTETDWTIQKEIENFNKEIRKFPKTYQNVKVIDFSDFTKSYSANQLIDWRFYFISQMGINPKLAPDFSLWFSNKLRGLQLNRKKCLVLDLDNTLWGGILGEDGINGIKVGGDYPGNSFLYFQEGLVELSKRGVILTVCSKNNEQDVLDVWEKNPFIVLTREYISAYRINWINKAENIEELSEELNIGLDSFVFIDDNPSERELVKLMLPMVEVPDFPKQPYMLPQFLMHLNDTYFKIYSITEEDQRKTNQYKMNAIRVQEQNKFTTISEYLSSLDIVLKIVPVDKFNLSRISQMTQKTNQFNLTTRRYSEADIRKFSQEGWLIYCLSVKDKFGDNGITGAILLNPIPDGWEIDSFLLSCRILGKGIENAFLSTVLNILRTKGIYKIKASYIPTVKNEQVSSFYDNAGFVLNSQDKQGNKHYELIAKENRIVEPYFIIEN